MAKKKSDASEKSQRKPPTKEAQAAPTKPQASKSPSTGAASDAPRIDTSLAANAAAAMIGNKSATPPAASLGGGNAPPKKESAAFKQLKAGLNKPAAGALGGAFGIAGGGKKSHLPTHGGKQVGRNQTFGADVNRAGVPRRTPG